MGLFNNRNKAPDTYPANTQRTAGATGYNDFNNNPNDPSYQGGGYDRFDNGPTATRDEYLPGQGRHHGGEFGRGGAGANAGTGFDRDRDFDNTDYGRSNVGGGYGNDPRTFDNNQGYNATGGPGMGGMTNDGPATGHFNSGGRGGAGTNFTNGPNDGPMSSRQAAKLERNGKLEHAAGTLLSSQSMKAKGLAKESEGKAMRMQAQEIEQAERLEEEARIRRERAVAGGAHPTHGIPPVRGAGANNY